jgi:hypothetical protein
MINGFALQKKVKEHLSKAKLEQQIAKWQLNYSKSKPDMLERYNERVNRFIVKVLHSPVQRPAI